MLGVSGACGGGPRALAARNSTTLEDRNSTLIKDQLSCWCLVVRAIS